VAWWTEYEELLVGMAEEEARDLFNALRSGDTAEAKGEIAAQWIREDRDSWRAYRDGTTTQLEGIARRRADLIEALEDLGKRTAKLIGRAAAGVLGIP
jgi:ferric-dicitrate binding protein FerR (iron transport regulator)